MAPLLRNFELVILNSCPGNCAQKATPPPWVTPVLFSMIIESSRRLRFVSIAPPLLSLTLRRPLVSRRRRIDTRKSGPGSNVGQAGKATAIVKMRLLALPSIVRLSTPGPSMNSPTGNLDRPVVRTMVPVRPGRN